MTGISIKIPDAELMEVLRIPCVHVPDYAQPVALKPGIYMGLEAMRIFDSILAECSLHSRFCGGQSVMEPAFGGRAVHYSPHLPPDAVVIVPNNEHLAKSLCLLVEARERAVRKGHEQLHGEMERLRRLHVETRERELKTVRYTLKEPIRWRRCIALAAAIAAWIIYAVAVWKF